MVFPGLMPDAEGGSIISLSMILLDEFPLLPAGIFLGGFGVPPIPSFSSYVDKSGSFGVPSILYITSFYLDKLCGLEPNVLSCFLGFFTCWPADI